MNRMHPTRWLTAALAVLLALAALPACAGGDIVFENDRFRAVLGPDAIWRSVRDKTAGRACLAEEPRPRFAAVKVDGKWHEAASAALDGDRLTVGFAGADTRLVYRVETRPGWVSWHIETVAGARPTHVILARLATSVSEHVGPRLCGGWDATTGVCLVTTSLQSYGRGRRRGKSAELTLTSQDAPGPRLEGAGAALVVAPTADLDATLGRLARACGLPTNANADGVQSKHLPMARGSYWFLRFGAGDVDRVLDLCRQSGFRQVMMLSHSWCKDVGHYTFRTDAYPDGIDSLKRTVGRLHEAGILVGMHCYASKISKTDAYVTPVPDRRFWVDRTATLAGAVDARAASGSTRRSSSTTRSSGTLSWGRRASGTRSWAARAARGALPLPRTPPAPPAATTAWTAASTGTSSTRRPTCSRRPPAAWPTSSTRAGSTWSTSTAARTWTAGGSITTCRSSRRWP